MNTQKETNVIEKIDIQLPGKYNVIFHNDDVTPMGFVVEILVNIFSFDRQKAVELMLDIHHNGKGVAGTYVKSIDEAKVTLVRDVALKAEYPLNVTIEKA